MLRVQPRCGYAQHDAETGRLCVVCCEEKRTQLRRIGADFSGGATALFGALTIAELSGALPRSGGIFAYLLESFGPLPAFMFGWTELAVVRASALGATATIFAEYLGYFVPLSPREVRYVAAAA